MLDNTKEIKMTYLKHIKINIAIASVMLVLILIVGSMSASSVLAHPPKDIEDVKTKLQIQVDKGDLTQQEADERLSTFEQKITERQANIEAKIEEMNLKIQVAIDNGDITKQQADKKIAHFQERLEKRSNHNSRLKIGTAPVDLEKFQDRLSSAVENGDLTPEEAEYKLEKIQGKIDERKRQFELKLDEIKSSLSIAVENGDLTQEQADEKIAHFQEKFDNGPKHGKHGKHGKEIRSQIQSALDNGKLTSEEADRKFLQITDTSQRFEKMISY